MSVITDLSTQYSTDLCLSDSKEVAYLGRLLGFVEGVLESKGIIFHEDGAAASTFTRRGTVSGACEYMTPYFQVLGSTLTLKKYSDSGYSKSLTQNTDYLLSRHRTTPNPAYHIELINDDLGPDDYLEVSALQGFGKTIPKDLSFEIFNFAQEAINQFSRKDTIHDQSGMEKASTSIGKVNVTYRQPSESKSGMSIAQLFNEQTQFHSVINKYALP
jgi:hypothetical protein